MKNKESSNKKIIKTIHADLAHYIIKAHHNLNEKQ